MRSRYKILEDSQIYFVTSTIVEWLPVFTSEKYFNLLIEPITFCQKNKNLKVYSYVMLDDHFHMIISCENTSRVLSSIKMFSAKKIIENLKVDNKEWLINQLSYFRKKYKINSEHQVWQEGFHPQIIYTEEVLNQKIEYIHNNPVRRGLVNSPEHWKFSSALDYYSDQNGPIEIDRSFIGFS